jgi:hypothetical protein
MRTVKSRQSQPWMYIYNGCRYLSFNTCQDLKFLLGKRERIIGNYFSAGNTVPANSVSVASYPVHVSNPETYIFTPSHQRAVGGWVFFLQNFHRQLLSLPQSRQKAPFSICFPGFPVGNFPNYFRPNMLHFAITWINKFNHRDTSHLTHART